MTKKHFCKLNTCWLQQYVYFIHLKHKVSWISYYKFPILEGSHQSAVPKLSKARYVLRCIKQFKSQDALKSIYYSYFHSLITYGIIFGITLHTVFIFFDFRRRQLESLWGQDQGIPVENCLRTWGSYRYSLSTYFPFCYLLWTIRIFSM